MSTKRYELVNRRTGKISKRANTRAEARAIKASNGFKHFIYDTVNDQVVR